MLTLNNQNNCIKTLRNTRQKNLIKKVLSENCHHSTAEEIYNCVLAADPSIGRATVYRALADMSASGQLLRVCVFDGADRFDTTLYPHSHAKCRICGRVVDIETDNITIPTCKSDGFTIEKVNVLYQGVCKNCNK